MPDIEPMTPEWWLNRLHKRIESRRPDIEKMWRYYDGEHRLAFASEKFLEAFGGMFRAFADNWCALVADAVEERLDIEGFRLGQDPSGDREAWRIWQANGLDAESQLAHTEALVAGEAYGTAWYGHDLNTPVITVEPASNAVVECSPANRRVRVAGLRTYCDEWGYLHAELFLPDAVWLFRSENQSGGIGGSPTWREDSAAVNGAAVIDGPGAWQPNPLGVVPMVPLTNRPRLARHKTRDVAAQSEIAAVIPLQDGVNKLIADLLVTSEDGAMPKRYALGLEELPPPEAFDPRKKVWVTEGDMSKATVGQFDAADLGQFVKSIELLVQHIASQTRTPPHYFYLSGQFPSGESIKSAETGLVSKARRKMRHFGEGWEELVTLGLRVIGDTRGDITDSETIWGDPESRTESEHVDALVKKKQLGVPDAQLQEDAGYSPQQIERFGPMLARQALQARILAPAAPAAPVAPTTPVPEPSSTGA